MTERARAMLNREFSVRTWQLVVVALGQILVAAATAGWVVAKYDERLTTVEEAVATEHEINVVQGDHISRIDSARFKDSDGDKLSQLAISNRERLSVVESDMRNIKEGVVEIKAGQKDILEILRTR